MAQVKKLSSGGTPSSKYFMFNGTKVVEGDDNFKQFEQQALNGNRFAQRMLETLRKDSYDNKMVVNNTDTGVEFENVDMNYKKERTGRQFEKGRGWGVRTREGKDLIRDGVALRASNTGSDTKKENTSDNKITRSNRMFDYNDGVYDEFSANNAKYENDVRNIANYFSHGSAEEAAKHFDVSDLGDVDALWTIYNNAAGQIDFEQFLKDVKSQRRSADWDNPTYRLLKNFGFTGYDSNSPEEIEAANAIKLKKLGFDPKKAKGVLSFDDDGNLILTQDFLNSFGSEFGNKKGNYHFNDMFSNMLVNGKDNPYAWLNGWTSIGGKLYKSDDQIVKDFLVNSGYQDKNKQSLYTDANDIMQSLWGNQIKFDSYSPENFHSQWMSDKKGLHYRGISGFDVGKDSLGRNNQLIEYYDDSDARDEYGFVTTPRYAILDGNGEFVKDINLNDLKASGERGFSEVTLNSILDSSNGKHFAGKYENLFQGTNGLSDLRVFTDPKTGETFIQDSDLKGNQRGKAVKLPTELAKMLNDQKFYNYIASDKNAKNRFYKMLRGLTSSGVGDIFIYPDGLLGARTLRIKNDLKKAGYTAEQAEQISNLLEEWSIRTRKKSKEYGLGPSKSERSAAILLEAAPTASFKTGGKIEKHELGDLVGESKGTKGATKVNKIQGKQESLKQAWGLGSKDSKEFGDADWMDLGAAVSDLAALGITLADPTNIAGAIAGGVGSLATFAADVKRDGFQGRDIRDLGGNLLLDLGTALPVFGDILSGKKAIKGIKKAAPILSKAIKAGAIIGISDAVVNTIDAIVKGESFTISDMRRVINGISGATTIKRTGLLSPRGKKVDVTPELTVKGKKEGVADITLSKEEISDILSKDSNKQMEALTNLLAKKTNKSASEVGDMFDLKALLKDKKSLQWKFWKGRKSEKIANLGEIKQKRVPLTESEIQKLAKERNAFQNWFFGTGAQQRQFYNSLRNPGKHRYTKTDLKLANSTTPVSPQRAPFRQNLTFSKGVPAKGGYMETGLRPATPIPSNVDPSLGALVPMTSQSRWIPKTNTVPGHWDSFNPSFKRFGQVEYTNQIPGIFMPNIASHNLIPEEVYYPGTEPVYEFKKGGILKASDGSGSLGKNIDWGTFAIKGLETANFARALGETRKVKDLYNRKASALENTQLSSLPEVSMRFQDPGYHKYDSDVADLYMRTGYQNQQTSDPKLQAASMLGTNKLAMDHLAQKNQALSTNWSQFMNNYQTQKNAYNQANWDIDAKNKQIRNAATNLRLTGEADANTQRSQILDKASNALQGELTLQDRAKYSIAQQKNAILSSSAYASNPDVYKPILAQLDSDDYFDTVVKGLRYTPVRTAKKGGKVERSVSEQMLLDNQKIVAKALEKMSDNTMKLILKALS